MRDALPVGFKSDGTPDHRCRYKTVAEAIDKGMRTTGLTAHTIARQIGISTGVVQEYRRGHIRPSDGVRTQLETILGVSIPTGLEKEFAEPMSFQTVITIDKDAGTFSITGNLSELKNVLAH